MRAVGLRIGIAAAVLAAVSIQMAAGTSNPVSAESRLAPGARQCFSVEGSPGDVALVNLTPVQATGRGYGLLVSSNVTGVPDASNVNFDVGTTDPNVAAATIGADGRVCYLNSEASTHLIADHLGTIDADAYTAAQTTGAPLRNLDTRPVAPATTPTGSCEPSARLRGATEMMPPPVWCSIVNSGPGTEIEGANSWVDDFDHGLSFADFSGTKYREFTGGWLGKAKTWRHANHWMVDMVANPNGGSEGIVFMRPDRTFRFQDGKLIVEAVVAAGIEEYGSPVWPELLVTTGAQPDFTKHGNYGYEKFPEDWTLGCRLQSTGYPVCALKSNNGKIGSAYGSRVYEIAPVQVSGSTNYYAPFDGIQAHRFCTSSPMQNPDTECRDLFRLELTETSLTLYVNGVKHFEQTGLPRFPVADQDLYVYFPSVIAGLPSGGARFHWDRLAVNP
jgi:hypothetical protein